MGLRLHVLTVWRHEGGRPRPHRPTVRHQQWSCLCQLVTQSELLAQCVCPPQPPVESQYRRPTEATAARRSCVTGRIPREYTRSCAPLLATVHRTAHDEGYQSIIELGAAFESVAGDRVPEP